jgi:hypothetical protein
MRATIKMIRIVVVILRRLEWADIALFMIPILLLSATIVPLGDLDSEAIYAGSICGLCAVVPVMLLVLVAMAGAGRS